MIKLVQTCGACPEQYDAYKDGVRVGYLRLRHGCFTVECNGKEVYMAYPDGDGIFETHERVRYLNEAVDAIEAALIEENIEPKYEIVPESEV